MHTITIGAENLLRFHECFDDKMISKKDPLVEKFDLLIKTCGILHKCGKILKGKDRANILRHLESCHVASKCLVTDVTKPRKGDGELGMGNGEWGMGNGEWGNGEWGMGNGEWGMGNGRNGEWGNGEWGMGNGEWGMGNGKLKMGKLKKSKN